MKSLLYAEANWRFAPLAIQQKHQRQRNVEKKEPKFTYVSITDNKGTLHLKFDRFFTLKAKQNLKKNGQKFKNFKF